MNFHAKTKKNFQKLPLQYLVITLKYWGIEKFLVLLMIDTRYKLFRSQIEMFVNARSREDNWIFLNPSERTENWKLRNKTKWINFGIDIPSQSSLGRCIDMDAKNGRAGQSATYTAFGLVLDTIAEKRHRYYIFQLGTWKIYLPPWYLIPIDHLWFSSQFDPCCLDKIPYNFFLNQSRCQSNYFCSEKNLCYS